MINPEQIRAARAMLDWSTSDLAKRSGLTVNGLNKIERGHVRAKSQTLEGLQQIFENEGIEFLPGSGLRLKDNVITILEGEDANTDLALDVYETLKTTGGELLISYSDDERVTRNLDQNLLANEISRRTKANIKHRFLVGPESTHRWPTLVNDYNLLPEQYSSPYPVFIYGPKFALLSPDLAPKAIIIDHPLFAEAMRRLFNFMWDHTDPAPNSPAKNKPASTRSAKTSNKVTSDD